MHARAQQHLTNYEVGNISRQALANSLILLSSDVDPSLYFDELPEDLKVSIRESIDGLSADPADHVVIGGISMNGTFEEVQAAVDNANKRSFDAHWKMRRYLFGDGVPNA